MSRIFIWFWLSCKRQCKRPAFLLLLFLLPAVLYGARYLEAEDQEGIAVAVYAEEDGLSQDIVDNLLKHDGLFRFYESESEEALQEDVAAKRAECGYVFSKGLKERLDQDDFKRSIGIYSAPSTVAASLSAEVVFAGLMEVYGRDLLEDFVRTDDLFAMLDADKTWAEIEPLFEKRYNDGSTFSFAYQTMDQVPVEQTGKGAIFPVRGLMAVYIYVIGLFAAVTLGMDEKKGLFIPVPSRQRVFCALASMMAPVMLAALSGLAALWLTGAVEQLPKEAGTLFVYVCGVVLFGYVLKRLVKSQQVLVSLIPFLAMGSLVFCPVFIDAGKWIPGVDKAGRFFLPFYYLQFWQ